MWVAALIPVMPLGDLGDAKAPAAAEPTALRSRI